MKKFICLRICLFVFGCAGKKSCENIMEREKQRLSDQFEMYKNNPEVEMPEKITNHVDFHCWWKGNRGHFEGEMIFNTEKWCYMFAGLINGKWQKIGADCIENLRRK